MIFFFFFCVTKLIGGKLYINYIGLKIKHFMKGLKQKYISQKCQIVGLAQCTLEYGYFPGINSKCFLFSVEAEHFVRWRDIYPLLFATIVHALT